MKILSLLILFTSSTFLLAQEVNKLRKITEEYSSKKPKKNNFAFSWSKEYDISGNLINHTFTSSYPNNLTIVRVYNYKYNSDNKLVEFRAYSEKGNRKTLTESKNLEYVNDTTFEYKKFYKNDSLSNQKKTYRVYDNKGNLIRKQEFRMDSMGVYRPYRFKEHRYVYDSLNRVIIDSLCSPFPECKITTFEYGNDTMKEKKFLYVNGNYASGTPTDSIFRISHYTFHPNDSVATLKTYMYSSLTEKRFDLSQFFQYDSLGNIIEFYVIGHSKKNNKKESHHKYFYMHNENDEILTKIRHTLLPKKQKGKIYYRYSYEYW